MSLASRAIGSGVVLAMILLALADYVFKERFRIPADPGIGTSYEQVTQEEGEAPTVLPDGSAMSSPANADPIAGTASSGSAKRVVKKGVSTKKRSALSLDVVFQSLRLIATPTSETSLLEQSAPGAEPKKTVLLRDNDRAMLFSWIENDEAKSLFLTLKQALLEQFSVDVADLVDETRTEPDKPPVDVLSFVDPAISSERIVFARIRNRLYEIRVSKNGEPILEQLLTELSK